MKRFWLYLFSAGLLAVGASRTWAQTGGTNDSTPASPPKELQIQIHGFAEADLMTDDTRSFPEVVG
ncbi:MAG TPA: hypothetical protein VJ873_02545, partial [bacterium]|nr:hypothetical protein [bacterium]